MYHLGDSIGHSLSDTEKGTIMNFIMRNLKDMEKSSYNNASLNTINKLRLFLRDTTNGFKYNKNKFR
jgi:hypothetical protein